GGCAATDPSLLPVIASTRRPTPRERNMLDRFKQRYWNLRTYAGQFRQGLARRRLASLEDSRLSRGEIGTPLDHAVAAVRWLARAQDHGGCGGVSKCYRPVPGRWEPAYPETSGSVIGSFLSYAQATGAGEYRERARRIADWLVEIQLPGGGIQAGTI